MTPYRKMPSSAPETRPDRNAEELILYGLLVAIGAIPVALALVQGGVFGVEPTLGLVMLCMGLLGVSLYLRRNRGP